MSLAIYSLFCLFIAYSTIYVLRIIRSPLWNIPAAHWSCRFSGLFILYTRFRRRENAFFVDCHQRLGPLVLMSPTEISVNDAISVRTIYTSGWRKPEWYSLFRNVGGTRNMFTTPDEPSHAALRKVLSPLYSKSYLLSTQSPVQSLVDQVVGIEFVKHIEQYARNKERVRMTRLFSRAMIDVTTMWIFGPKLRSRYLDDEAGWDVFANSFGNLTQGIFLIQEFPRLYELLSAVGLKPGFGISYIDQWCLEKCRQTEERAAEGDVAHGEAGVWNNLYQEAKLQEKVQVRDHQLADSARNEIASEILDHTFASFETTAIALTYAVYELSRSENIQILESMREELRGVAQPKSASASQSPLLPLKTIDNLPLLSAVLTETLRIYHPVPGHLPRISPHGAKLDGIGEIPEGIRISGNAASLHRNPVVFPKPNQWIPARWIKKDVDDDARLKKMNRWFWAFSNGSRMCIGNHFALLLMKAVLAAIYRDFITEIVDASGIEQLNGVVVGPRKEFIARFVNCN